MKLRNANGSSGRTKRRNLGSVDRISDLPDSILGIILSNLPTKNAVSTSLLSKRWKLVWILVDNLDLCYKDSQGKQDERNDMRFVKFVDRVLLHHDAGLLNKLRLVWSSRCKSSHATTWINTAISKNVHELFLRLETVKKDSYWHTKGTSSVPFVMPKRVFKCETLRILELSGGISVSKSIEFCLPKLDTIRLESIHFQSEKAFEKLIRGCPVLINLYLTMSEEVLTQFYRDDDFRYVISSTSLRRFEVDNQYSDDVPWYIDLELDAPSLEYLTLYGFMPAFHEKKRLSSLVEAKLNVDLGDCDFSDVNMCNSIVETVRMFDCAKALILSEHIIWALSCATIRLSTEFNRLVKLEAETYSCACSSLRDFIECSDNLEVIEFLSVSQNDGCSEEIVFDKSKWIAPLQVPRCLSNSLKKIKIEGYYGMKNEREMVRYMLKHGNAFDMEIIFDNDGSEHGNTKSKSKLVQEIRALSKKLSNKFSVSEVKFSGETSKCNIKVL